MPKFKVGDKVRCVYSEGPWSFFVLGEDYTVAEVKGRLIGVSTRVSFETAYNSHLNFELTRDAPPLRRFVASDASLSNVQKTSCAFGNLDEALETATVGAYIYELVPVARVVVEKRVERL